MSNEVAHSPNFLQEIREILQRARRQTAAAISLVMVEAYWQIGKRIVEEEQRGMSRAEYAQEILHNVAAQLTGEFGRGFSARNLANMRKFYLAYRERQLPILQTLSAKSNPTDTDTLKEQQPNALLDKSGIQRFSLSWSHYVFLIAVKDEDERQFYELEATQQQWSLRELKRQFNSSLYERLALSREKDAVRRLALEGQQIMKPRDLLRDPYVLEFLALEERSKYSESDLETAIIDKLEHFLLELGKGFLFEARQKRFTYAEEHFFVDLVFYNRLLRCYVLLDLKIGKLTHQDLGQMQMYVNYFDRHVKLGEENPTVGIILCKQKNDAMVEITLPQDTNIFAAQYQLYLPSKEELKQKLLDWTAEQEKWESEDS
ncbi:MAG: DUF1016 family protein [Caldilineaceae bacterium]|nr:DUF1016 family protein [Caldilineaceae bacterium]